MDDSATIQGMWPLEIQETPAPTGVLLPDGREIWLDSDLNTYTKNSTGQFVPELVKTATPAGRLVAIQRVVKNQQYEVIEGVLVDWLTANLIIAVLKRLNETNRCKLLSYRVDRIAAICYEVTSK